jgi:hypothetical protein
MPTGDGCSKNTCNRILTDEDRAFKQCSRCREQDRLSKGARRSHKKRKEGDSAVNENAGSAKKPKLSNGEPPEGGAEHRRAPLKAVENRAPGGGNGGDEVGTCSQGHYVLLLRPRFFHADIAPSQCCAGRRKVVFGRRWVELDGDWSAT